MLVRKGFHVPRKPPGFEIPRAALMRQYGRPFPLDFVVNFHSFPSDERHRQHRGRGIRFSLMNSGRRRDGRGKRRALQKNPLFREQGQVELWRANADVQSTISVPPRQNDPGAETGPTEGVEHFLRLHQGIVMPLGEMVDGLAALSD